MTTSDCTVMMQVEETFMQQVVMYWQGSATAAANTVAMQSDQQASAYSGPPDASMGQVDRQGGQAGPQAVDATSLSSRDAETKELPVAGKHHDCRSSCLLEQTNGIAFQQAMLCLSTGDWFAFQQAVLCFSANSLSKQCHAAYAPMQAMS